ncbi:glycosyl transferase [Brachybacterium faecium DSM 4810]|uniref:Glycosyl transferase n=1 Tax=Brachybacterium faecium (strain ATCC 43885 / DSM 4810 / JCM 11609 / LMG 19847 / NBRC 14762 / NCIMB 9860 / 6-10) TaxID=446465 RepID=C7MH80_BRAFD|nr:glycosyltransferase [Brachybacterium faecium]ACU86528.1 glycosyl transferase [Brachybacterium faecium DSM 4810]
MRTALTVGLAVLYALLAVIVFGLTGVFGGFGELWWRDAAVLLLTVVAACALTYVSLLLMTFLREVHHPRNSPGDPDALQWHVLVPCRDEESVIAETVSAARTSFPGMHVWVIDDASEDATARVVQDLMVFDDRVHLISRIAPEARTGKGDALNAAYRIVSDHVGADVQDRHRTVVGVLDADGFLSDNALTMLAGPEAFGEETTGAVQLEVWMKNRGDRRPRPADGRLRNAVGRVLVRMQDLEFRTTNSAMQVLRSRTGTVGMGGNGQFTRLSVLDSLAEEHERPWGRKLCEDYELGLNILEQGLRTHYVREAHVSQEALPFTRRLITQRTRWAQGNMECASALPGLRRSGHLSAAGLVEIHYFMLQPLIMMLNLVLVPLLLALGLVQDPGGFWSAATLLTLVLAGLFFLVLPYAVWGLVYRSVSGGEVSLLGAAGLGLCNLVYVYLTYVYYARAAWRSLTGRTGWAKTRRNADGRTLAAVPVTAALEALPLMRLEEFEELTAELEGRSDLGIDFVAGWAVMWPTRSSRLERAIAAEQPAAIRDAIGSLRVSSAMVGAARLEQAATDLEQSLAGDDLEVCRAQLPLVIAIGRETVDLLRKEVSVRRSLQQTARPGAPAVTEARMVTVPRR